MKIFQYFTYIKKILNSERVVKSEKEGLDMYMSCYAACMSCTFVCITQ